MADEQRDNFRAAIEAKIAAWQTVLRSYDAAVSLDGAIGDVTPSENQPRREEPGKAVDLPVGIFRGKTIPEAIEIFLEARRRKQTNKEIAQGLKDGGIASTSANFEATLATALSRMRDDGKVLRFPDGWDLASSYPESLRTRLEKDSKPKAKGKKRGRGAMVKAQTKATEKAATPATAKPKAAEGISISKVSPMAVAS
jgi:hypothetical protein